VLLVRTGCDENCRLNAARKAKSQNEPVVIRTGRIETHGQLLIKQ